ncbi:BACK domain-containing protein [Trichonephila clavipes]|uniref:BACK domain-containing protein n=1 Tax=Trichonephila clavipes TaxID=2585209 RepID=A0A8X6VCX0_TRICX|nr:BACK domain-containing protein [Trichonephila clavipes]
MRGTLTDERYVNDILRPYVGPFLDGLPGTIFQQDNARPHTARVAQDFLRHFQNFPLPARSPDSSPVEHVWDQLKRQMPSCHYVHDLELAVQDLWAHLPQDNILTGKTRHDVHSVYTYVTARKLGLTEAATRALRTMCKRFEQIVGTPEFLDLTYDQVMEYLKSDVLATRSEVIAFLAALKWISVQYMEREQFATDVISCVRFPMMSLNEILACHSPPLLPGILEISEIKKMLLEGTWSVSALLNTNLLSCTYLSVPTAQLCGSSDKHCKMPHTSRTTWELIESFGWESLNNAPYSIDLAPSDFHLFTVPQTQFWWKVLSDKDVKAPVNSWQSDHAPDFCEEGFQNLLLRYDKCINKLGNYVEK